MTTSAQAGDGVTLGRGDGSSSEAFPALAELNSINFTGLSQDTIDVTSLDSTGGYREFIVAFKDAGELSLNMNFTIANFGLMKIDFEATTSRNYRVTFADTGATQFNFAAYVTGLGVNITLDDKINVDVSMKITGTITVVS